MEPKNKKRVFAGGGIIREVAVDKAPNEVAAFYGREADRLLGLARECRNVKLVRLLLAMASEYLQKLGITTDDAFAASQKAKRLPKRLPA